MNLAELGAVVTVLTGAIAGAAAAHNQKAGWATVLFAVGGLAVGVGVALAATKFAYAALHRAIRPPGERETASSIAFSILYLFTPLFSIALSGTAAVLLTILLLRLFQ